MSKKKKEIRILLMPRKDEDTLGLIMNEPGNSRAGCSVEVSEGLPIRFEMSDVILNIKWRPTSGDIDEAKYGELDAQYDAAPFM